MIYRKDNEDGTYFLWLEGDNKHRDHYHFGSDGTLLSIKEGKRYQYNRREAREKISQATGLDLDRYWSASVSAREHSTMYQKLLVVVELFERELEIGCQNRSIFEAYDLVQRIRGFPSGTNGNWKALLNRAEAVRAKIVDCEIKRVVEF